MGPAWCQLGSCVKNLKTRSAWNRNERSKHLIANHLEACHSFALQAKLSQVVPWWLQWESLQSFCCFCCWTLAHTSLSLPTLVREAAMQAGCLADWLMAVHAPARTLTHSLADITLPDGTLSLESHSCCHCWWWVGWLMVGCSRSFTLP
jgi:hypothetical protein